MTKSPIDYSNTIIYRIVCKDLNVTGCYVGHTTNFKERKRHHRDGCFNNIKRNDIKLYNTIRENGGWNNWVMIEIEKYPCNDSNEAIKRERYYYELFKADLNTVVPSRGKIEYREDNKEVKREYDANRRLKLYDEINKKIICECGGSYSNKHKSTHFKTKLHVNFIQHKCPVKLLCEEIIGIN